MPRTKSSGGAQVALRREFSVSPWQSKRSVPPRSAQDTYQETFVAPGSVLHRGGSGTADLRASCEGEKENYNYTYDPSAHEDFDAQLDGPDSSTNQPRSERVPFCDGLATIAVVGSPLHTLIGHVRDSEGSVALSFTTHVLLQQQECTRDDDWSLNVLDACVPGSRDTSQLLVEVTGGHAVRLRAPPATHGQEDLVASALERCNSYPCQEATLTFDCDQLHSAGAAQQVVRAEGLRVFDSVQAVAIGRFRLTPRAVA